MTKEDSSIHPYSTAYSGWVAGAARRFMLRDNVTNLELKLEKFMSQAKFKLKSSSDSWVTISLPLFLINAFWC